MLPVLVFKNLQGEIVYAFIDDLYTDSFRVFMGEDFNIEAEARRDYGDDFISVTDEQHAIELGAQKV